MISKDIVQKIKIELEHSTNSINSISERYSVSKATVNNINSGKSHREERVYPIRESNNYFSDNEVAFIRQLAKDGYSAKQIHILLAKGAYSTISNIIAHKTRVEAGGYKEDKFLEERKKVFDFLVTPHPLLVNTYTDQITVEDAQYIKLLGRFMADQISTIEIFMPLIESDMAAFKYKIETREDLERYLEWRGDAFKIIWWIKNIFVNKVNNLNGEPINYDAFPLIRFREVDPQINLPLIKEMIDFETKENYRKSE